MGLRQQGAWTTWEETTDKKIGTSCRGLNPSALNSSLSSSMMSCPAHQTSSVGGCLKPQHVPCAKKEEPWSRSSAAALKHSVMAAIAGAMTVCGRRLPSPYTLPLIRACALKTSRHEISFVRAGERPPPRPKAQPDLLGTAKDWQLKVDLGKLLKFPENIVEIRLRSDIALVSESRILCWS